MIKIVLRPAGNAPRRGFARNGRDRLTDARLLRIVAGATAWLAWVSAAERCAWADQAAEAATTRPVEESVGDDKPAPAAPTTQPARKRKYFRSKAINANRREDPVDYARPLSEFGLDDLKTVDWLNFGVEQRTRFEIRDDSYRTGFGRDQPSLHRTRAFLGVEKVIDPLRFGVEFQDSRAFNTDFPNNTSMVDHHELLQAYGELFFEDAFGPGQHARFQAGRLSLDAVDRRLFTRNGYRNTTNAFDGFRLQLGDPEADWEFNAFATQPVIIDPRSFNRPDEERWFWGFYGTWRGWDEYVTLEPYYFILDGILQSGEVEHGEIHTLGLHAFGPVAGTRFDYDVNVAFQTGHETGISRRAFATHAELGYTIDATWEPRLAAWVNYASGDRLPDDNIDQRFSALFGSSFHYFGFNEVFTWENVINPAFELRVKPTSRTEVATIYRAFWLASDQDAWIRASRVAPEGNAGDFVGQSIDIVLRHEFHRRLAIETGYGHFLPGAYARNTGDSPDSDFFFFQVVLRL